MKLRNGFVSNSSSSSFTINKTHLTTEQIDKIKNHITVGKDVIKYATSHDEWNITENSLIIQGYTVMTNFDMMQFLEFIGVKHEYIAWEDESVGWGGTFTLSIDREELKDETT